MPGECYDNIAGRHVLTVVDEWMSIQFKTKGYFVAQQSCQRNCQWASFASYYMAKLLC